ncbi:hypothetical protein WK79_30110 [Burkholderia ubonensis]|nr:hypothetical protein WK79_30110 [Burkholderia ubonensis]
MAGHLGPGLRKHGPHRHPVMDREIARRAPDTPEPQTRRRIDEHAERRLRQIERIAAMPVQHESAVTGKARFGKTIRMREKVQLRRRDRHRRRTLDRRERRARKQWIGSMLDLTVIGNGACNRHLVR